MIPLDHQHYNRLYQTKHWKILVHFCLKNGPISVSSDICSSKLNSSGRVVSRYLGEQDVVSSLYWFRKTAEKN